MKNNKFEREVAERIPAALGTEAGVRPIAGPVALVDPWQHRSLGMRCRSCMWFVEKESVVAPDAARGPVGRCRRHAPSMGGYPVVYATDWCGDHRIDETKA